jgi:hypothetical protein
VPRSVQEFARRDANPAKLQKRALDMRVPTGYFKVIYRPAIAEEPAHAIALLSGAALNEYF